MISFPEYLNYHTQNGGGSGQGALMASDHHRQTLAAVNHRAGFPTAVAAAAAAANAGFNTTKPMHRRRLAIQFRLVIF